MSRPYRPGASADRLSFRKPRLARQRTHSPFGPISVSGRPHVVQVPTIPDSPPTTSASALMPSIFDRDNDALDRHPPDPKRWSQPPSATLHDTVAVDAKATCEELRLGRRA